MDENKVAEYAQRSAQAWKCHTCGSIIPEGMSQWSLSSTKNLFNQGAYEPAYGEILRTWCDHCANTRDLLPESKIILNKLLTPNTRWVRTYQDTFNPSEHRFCEHCGTKKTEF